MWVGHRQAISRASGILSLLVGWLTYSPTRWTHSPPSLILRPDTSAPASIPCPVDARWSCTLALTLLEWEQALALASIVRAHQSPQHQPSDQLSSRPTQKSPGPQETRETGIRNRRT